MVLSAAETKTETEDTGKSAELLTAQLRHHRIDASAQSIPVNPKGNAEALIQAAHAVKADLLVMGAYGHSRVRELVFGGVTRHVLKACDLPVLMLH